MTVREWVTTRSANVPPTLTERMVALLGPDADASANRAGELCLSAARRALEQLLASGRFERDGALELLAVDALTTFAFEHASEAATGSAEIRSLAVDGARALSGIGVGNG